MFVLPSIRQSSPSLTSEFERKENTQFNNENELRPARTSSSSSFLQETKQLLEMISTNQNFDLSKFVSDV